MRASSSNPRSCRRSDVFVLGREGLVPGLLVDVLETMLVDVLEAESDGEFGATGVWQPRRTWAAAPPPSRCTPTSLPPASAFFALVTADASL